jgi:hypothetical protein
MRDNFEDDLINIIKLVRLEEPKNVVYLSLEANLYAGHHVKGLFLKNQKTLNYDLVVSELSVIGTEMLENGECVIFDRKGKAHTLVFEDFDKHVQEKHIN